MKRTLVVLALVLTGCGVAARNPLTAPAGVAPGAVTADATACAAPAGRPVPAYATLPLPVFPFTVPWVITGDITPLTFAASVYPIGFVARFFEDAPDTTDSAYQRCMQTKGYHVPRAFNPDTRAVVSGWQKPTR